ncbi:hypothetical protein ABPG72_015255 [Tetrahymena utriculariae]
MKKQLITKLKNYYLIFFEKLNQLASNFKLQFQLIQNCKKSRNRTNQNKQIKKSIKMILEQLNKCDIFGKQVILNYKNNGSIQTSLGGLISLATIVVICLFFWNTLLDFLSKNQVNLIQSQSFSNNPSLLQLNTNDFMFAVQIQQNNFLKNPYYNITLEQKSYTLLENGTRLTQTIPLDMEPCTISHWGMIDKDRLNNTFTSLGLNDYLCAKKNQKVYIGGQYESPIYQFLKFQVTKCVNVTKPQLYSWNPVCQSYASAQLFAQSTVRIQFQMSNYIFNPIEPQNLVQSIISSDLFFQIQPEAMYMTADIFFTQYNIQTDNSLFFTKDIQQQIYSVQQYGDYRPQYTQFSKGSTKPYATFYFDRSRFTYFYNRSYMKLQDMLSQLGGFVNSMIAMAAIIVGFYNRNYYVLELANKLYDYDIQEDQEKNESNSVKKSMVGNPQMQNADEGSQGKIELTKKLQIEQIQLQIQQKQDQYAFREDQHYLSPSHLISNEQIENSKDDDTQHLSEQIQGQSKQDTPNGVRIILNYLNQGIEKDTQRSYFTADDKLKQINIEMLSSNRQQLEKNHLLNDEIQNNFPDGQSNYLNHQTQQIDSHPKKLLLNQEYYNAQIQLPSIIEQENEQQSSVQKLELLSRGRKDFSQQSLNEKVKQQILKNCEQNQNNPILPLDQQINQMSQDEIKEDFHQSPGVSVADIKVDVNQIEDDKQQNLKNLQFEQKLPQQQHMLQNKDLISMKIPLKSPPKKKQKIEFIKTQIEDIYQNDKIINKIEQNKQDFQNQQQNEEKQEHNNDEEFLQQSLDNFFSDINEENINQQLNQIRQSQLFKSMPAVCKIIANNNQSDQISQAKLKKYQKYAQIKNISLTQGIDDKQEEENQSDQNQNFKCTPQTQILYASPLNFTSTTRLNQHFDDQSHNVRNQHDNQFTSYEAQNINQQNDPNFSDLFFSPFTEDNQENNSKKQEETSLQFNHQTQNSNFELKENFFQSKNLQNDNVQISKSNEAQFIQSIEDSQTKNQEISISRQKNDSIFKKAKIKKISSEIKTIQSESNYQTAFPPNNPGAINMGVDNQSKIYNQADYKKSLIQQELLKMNYRRQKISFSFKYVIYKLSCKRLFKTKQNQMVDKAQDLIDSNLDIIKILDKMQEIDRIKCLLLDYEQRILFSYFPKPLVQIKNNDQIKILDNHVESVYKKYAQNLHTQVNVIKTLVKATNKLKQKVDDKNHHEIKTIIDQSTMENVVNNFDRTYGISEYESIYKAYRKISTKPNKTHTDKILIELMGQELQKIFSQLDKQKTIKKKKFFVNVASKTTSSNQAISTPKQQKENLYQLEKASSPQKRSFWGRNITANN